MNIYVVARCQKCGNVVAAARADTVDAMLSAAKDGKVWEKRKGTTVSVEHIVRKLPYPSWCECATKKDNNGKGKSVT